MEIQSNKGKSMASCGKYLMRMAGQSADGTLQFWRCAKKGCTGGAQSSVGSKINLVERKHHNPAFCVPSPTTIRVKQKMTAVKRLAKDNPALSSQAIMIASKQGLSDLETEAFPKDSNIKKTITNARKPIGEAAVDRVPELMILSREFQTTAIGWLFLIYDSRVAEPNKPTILIFASEYGLRLLEQRSKWSGDGTFFSCPKYFKQLYTINVFEGESSLPAAFFLLPGKTEDMYKRAFDALFSRRPAIVPEAFMTDFERSPAKVLQERFPPLVINYCLFHLGQSLFKNLQKKGLIELYANAEVKSLIRSFSALAFLPQEEVSSGFDELVAALQLKMDDGTIVEQKKAPLKEYLKYIEQTYVRRGDINNMEVPPLYPIALWNCCQAVLADAPRTNNAIEGWHYQFNKRFQKTSMPLSYFIMQLKEEESLTRQLDVRHAANPRDPVRNTRKKAVVKADEQIKAIVERYSLVAVVHRNRIQFLRRVQRHLSSQFVAEPEEEGEPVVEQVENEEFVEEIVEESDDSYTFD